MAVFLRMAGRGSSFTHQADSLDNDITPRRPKLLRPSTTEPSITACCEIRGSHISSGLPERATEILSKVALCSSGSIAARRVSSPDMLEHAAHNIIHEPTHSSNNHDMRELLQGSPSECYFSFPNFDDWDLKDRNQQTNVFD